MRKSVHPYQECTDIGVESFYGASYLYFLMSIDEGLKRTHQEKTSHQELPYLIHSKTNVPYLMGKHGHTIVAVELKKYGWSIKLVKTNNDKYIAASKGTENWLIKVITTEASLSDALRGVKHDAHEELEAAAEANGSLPVIALVTPDSATLISARNFIGLAFEQSD